MSTQTEALDKLEAAAAALTPNVDAAVELIGDNAANTERIDAVTTAINTESDKLAAAVGGEPPTPARRATTTRPGPR